MLAFMKTDTLTMVNNTPLRIVINYWSKMTPSKTSVGNFPKADEMILSSKATTPPKKVRKKQLSRAAPPFLAILLHDRRHATILLFSSDHPQHIHFVRM